MSAIDPNNFTKLQDIATAILRFDMKKDLDDGQPKMVDTTDVFEGMLLDVGTRAAKLFKGECTVEEGHPSDVVLNSKLYYGNLRDALMQIQMGLPCNNTQSAAIKSAQNWC